MPATARSLFALATVALTVALALTVANVAQARSSCAPAGAHVVTTTKQAVVFTKDSADGAPLLAGPQAATADATALGALGVGVVPDQRLLAGADGTVTVSVSSRVAAPTRVGDVEVTLSLPDGYRARNVTATDWRCTLD